MHPIKLLKSKKGRRETGRFIVEGGIMLHEIPENWMVYYYACSKSYADTHDLAPYKRRSPVEIYKDSLFDSFCDTVTPQGVLAVCGQKRYSVESIIKPGAFLLMGECLSDPGNIGALIRTAAAAGVNGIILSRGSGELYNPKVLRAAAGAALRVPVIEDADLFENIKLCRQNQISVYAAHPKGDALPYDVNLSKGCAIVLGNETRGLSNELTALADARVQLPMPGGTESLNASVAGSVLLYEAVRQRLIKERS
jgi:TrmH family RNA methyltransferase